MARYISFVFALCMAASAAAQQVTGFGVAQSGNAPMVISGLYAPVTVNLNNVSIESALDAIARQASLRIFFGESVLADLTQVTIKATNIPAKSAIAWVLRGTGITYKVSNTGQIVFDKADARKPSLAQGVITGKVTDAKNGKGISGASVSTGSDNRGVSTGEDGTYKLTGVAAGLQTVTVRLVGYAKQSRSITVGEGATVTVDFKLDPSANVLDQVVVTGTVVSTELKAVPNAMTVITGKQLEERGITHIDQLFRGDIPGVFAQNVGSGAQLDEVTMFVRGATAVSSASSNITPISGNYITNPIKTYLDGVELIDPVYISQIDPKSIERIEILTGPQASTIYGSNALNGVMQVFTKRGSASTSPRFNVNLLSGWVENNFSNARTPNHDYSAQVNGTEGRFSYNVGGSWVYMGPWTPSKQNQRVSAFGTTRMEFSPALGRTSAELMFRRGNTRSITRGNSQQSQAGYRETGLYAVFGANGRTSPATSTLNGRTMGVTVNYVPTSWWTHEFGAGQDISEVETIYTERGYGSPSDTTLRVAPSSGTRNSQRYTTTALLPITDVLRTTITAGLDGWQTINTSIIVQPTVLTGTLNNVFSVRRQPSHNTGVFVQTQVGLWDRLFLTYGLRGEWNPNFGEEAEPNMAPRYGVAYTHEMGSLTTKLRGSYGRSTRPPQQKLKSAQTAVDAGQTDIVPVYGNYDFYLANPELGPEHQSGGEGGVELYWGSRASLVVTRYNQVVNALISPVRVDSIRSLARNPLFLGSFSCTSIRQLGFPDYCVGQDAEGYAYAAVNEYLNVAGIRNQGWELQGSVNAGPLTTRGTYSWTKSRSLGINPKYRGYFSPTSFPLYYPGATFNYLPEHTWALGMTYTQAGSTVGINVTGTGQLRNFRNDFYLQTLEPSIRLNQNRYAIGGGPNYVNFNKGYAMADLTASHSFSPKLEGLLQVQNLTDYYKNDYNALLATMGRQTKIGLRWRN